MDAPAHVDLSATKFLTTVVPAFDDAFFNDDDDKDNDDWDGSDSPTDFPEDVTLEPGNAATSAPSVPSSDGITTDVPQPAPVAEETNTPTTVGGEVESPAPTSVDVSTVATPAPTSDRRKRRLDENTESLAGGAPRVKQMLDVVFFLIPETCKTNIWGSCDWSTLGVGMRDDRVSGGVNYCCSEDAVSDGLCPSDQMGRLIINPNFFKGEIKTLQVPTEADTEFELDNPLFDVSLTGEYVLLLANCDDYGMDVFSLGSMEWKSVKGYLPGEIFDLMFFYSALTIVYLILVLWYYCGMRMYQDAAIPIQKFILTTIVLGLLEFFFRSLDLGTWNVDGLRSKFIVWLGTSTTCTTCCVSKKKFGSSLFSCIDSKQHQLRSLEFSREAS